MLSDNHYKTLGVNLHASTNLIRTNAHDLIAACHKVKNIDVQVVNDAISKMFVAREILSDESKRAEYDQNLSEQEQEDVRQIYEHLLPSCWTILKLNETDFGRAFKENSLVRQRKERLESKERQARTTERFPVIDWNTNRSTNEEIKPKLSKNASLRSTHRITSSESRESHQTCHKNSNDSKERLKEEDDDDVYIYVKNEDDNLHESLTVDLRSDSSNTTSSTYKRSFRTQHGSTTSPEPENDSNSGDVAIKEATTLMKKKEKAYQKAKLEMRAAKAHLKGTLDEEWRMESSYLKRRRDELEQKMEDLKFDEDTVKRKYLRHDTDAEKDTLQSSSKSRNSMALVKRNDLSLVQFAKEPSVFETPIRVPWKPDEVREMVELMEGSMDALKVIGILASKFGHMRSKSAVLRKYKEIQDRWKSYQYLKETSESGRLRSGAYYKRVNPTKSKRKHDRPYEKETNINCGDDDNDDNDDDSVDDYEN